MPFFDFNENIDLPDGENFDFVIIGSGVAGILLSISLTRKGKKVLVLESGHWHEDEEKQALNQVTQTGKQLQNVVWGRKRAIGGTSIAWGGQSLPFSPIDFEKKDWVAASGWPLSFDEIAPYYYPANEFMQVDKLNYDGEIFELLKMQKIPFDNSFLYYHFSKWAPQPVFSVLYRTELEKKVTIFYNAHTTQINTDENGRAESVTVKNFRRKTTLLKVKNLLLATGAIEASRLLLLGNKRITDGLGNHSGWLGKCFMDHPCIEAASVTANSNYKLQKNFNTHMLNRRKYSLRLSLSEKAQREQALLNASAGIMFYYPEDQFDPYTEIKKVIKKKDILSLPKFFGGTEAYLKTAFALAKDNFIYKHGAFGKLVVMLEQAPLAKSYIKLSKMKDQFGNSKAEINWQVSYQTWETLLCLIKYVKQEFEKLSLGSITPFAYVTENNPNWEACLTDVNHHMGGTRMSKTAADGVVDNNLKLWGYDNIYVCSSSVFPTGSHSNPTLTLMALCQRLVDHLK